MLHLETDGSIYCGHTWITENKMTCVNGRATDSWLLDLVKNHNIRE